MNFLNKVALCAKSIYTGYISIFREAETMKANFRALAAAGLCICMALGTVGCGKGTLDGAKTVATVGEKAMTLGEANFLLRFQQSQTESMYESLIGDSIYDKDLYGNGTNFGDTMKDGVMQTIRDYYILEDKAAEYGVALTEEETAKIAETAKAFLDANEKYTKEQMTADQETVERILTLMTIGTKTADAVGAEANVTVTDEEAAQRGFSYVTATKNVKDEETGEGVPMTEDELAAEKDKLTALAGELKAGADFKEAAEAAGYMVSEGAYSADNTGAYAEEVLAALDGMKEGDVSEIIETETTLYLVKLTEEVDAEATVARKEALKDSKEAEYYNGLMAEWREAYPLEIVEDVWKEVVFDRSYDVAK